ncbi:MAG: hypothetical protein HC904_15060 [Blastochloris sp.]|nr:hypothetical protein [Blastochloris sp.]
MGSLHQELGGAEDVSGGVEAKSCFRIELIGLTERKGGQATFSGQTFLEEAGGSF